MSYNLFIYYIEDELPNYLYSSKHLIGEEEINDIDEQIKEISSEINFIEEQDKKIYKLTINTLKRCLKLLNEETYEVIIFSALDFLTKIDEFDENQDIYIILDSSNPL